MGSPCQTNYTENMFYNEIDQAPFISVDAPEIAILEQPQARGYRYRYGCEGPSHGGLQGQSSEKGRKTYPKIAIANLCSPKAQVRISLWTADEPRRRHVHDLIGKHCERGQYVIDVKPDTNGSYDSIVFNDLSIGNTKRIHVMTILKDRKLEQLRLVSGGHLSATQERLAAQEAEEEARAMPLNVVRLKFEVGHEVDHNFMPVASVMSDPIFDSKSTAANVLKICKVDRVAGSCAGGEDVFLLCEKVQKDVKVRFIEREEGSRQIKWHAVAKFNATDIHHQYAIVFKTPAYKTTELQHSVQVELQLYRPSDEQESAGIPFTFHPMKSEQDEITRKRRRPAFLSASVGDISPSEPSISEANTSRFGVSGYHFPALPPFNTLNLYPSSIVPGNNDYVPFNSTMASFNYGAYGHTSVLAQCAASGDTQNSGLVPTHPQLSTLPEGSMTSEVITPSLEILAPFDFDQLLQQQPSDLSGDGVVEMDAELTDTCQDLRGHPALAEAFLDGTSLKLSDSPVLTSLPSYRDSEKVAYIKAEYSRSEVPSWLPSHLAKSDSDTAAQAATAQRHAEEAKDTSSQLHPSGSTVMPGERGTSSKMTAMPHATFDVVERLTSGMVIALRDYACTGDIRFVLASIIGLATEPDDHGDNALHLSVIHNRHNVLQYLLSAGGTVLAAAAIDQPNDAGQTPLHIAAMLGLPRSVDLLLQYGASAHCQDHHGNTCWHLAARCASLSSLRILRSATECRQDRTSMNVINYDGHSALHLAVQGCHLDCVKELVASGASVSVADGKSGHSALHYAVESGNYAMADYLINEALSDVNQQSYSGNTPLHVACALNNLDLVALLIVTGADPDIENSDPTECEENTDDDEDTGECCMHGGYMPRDLACNNEKILNILEGKPYWKSGVRQSVLGSKAIAAATLHSGCDMSRLDNGTRHLLANVLDRSPADWASLAAKVGLENMVPSFRKQSSPTCSLLEGYEVIKEGTVSNLRLCLSELNLHDAVALLDQRCLPCNSEEDMRFDSGVETSVALLDA